MLKCGVKALILSQGKIAIVDDEDFEMLSRYKWTYSTAGYAYRMEYFKGSIYRNCVLMHREIMNTPVGMDTDHINKNTLDNRRVNLRICTHQQNTTHKVRQKNNTSGYRGVFWSKQHQKWRGIIECFGKRHSLGLFIDKKECAVAYDEAANYYFGEFAVKNL